MKTKHKGTAWLTVVADCAKCSVATLAEAFYHVTFMKYQPTVITHILSFLLYLFQCVAEA